MNSSYDEMYSVVTGLFSSGGDSDDEFHRGAPAQPQQSAPKGRPQPGRAPTGRPPLPARAPSLGAQPAAAAAAAGHYPSDACAVCLNGDSEAVNKIVYCEGCGVAVHQVRVRAAVPRGPSRPRLPPALVTSPRRPGLLRRARAAGRAVAVLGVPRQRRRPRRCVQGRRRGVDALLRAARHVTSRPLAAAACHPPQRRRSARSASDRTRARTSRPRMAAGRTCCAQCGTRR